MATKEPKTKTKIITDKAVEPYESLMAEIAELKAKLSKLEGNNGKSPEELAFKPSIDKLDGKICQNHFKPGISFKTMSIGNDNWIELRVGENQTGWYPVVDGVIYVDPVIASLDANTPVLQALGMKTALPEGLSSAMDAMLEDIENMCDGDDDDDEHRCCEDSAFVDSLPRCIFGEGAVRPRHIFRLF